MRVTEDQYAALLARSKGQKMAEPLTLPKQKQIVRQSNKELNKTETRFKMTFLDVWLHDGMIDRVGGHESLRFALSSSMTLSPDFPVWKEGKLWLYEVKGAFIREDALIKLKTWPLVYPEHPLWLYQWKGGEWIAQLMKA